jgi:hypothetical protein
MPRVDGSAGVRFHIPGVYAALLRHEWVTGRWARWALLSDGSVVERRPLAEREAMLEEFLAAGEPFEVPKFYIGAARCRLGQLMRRNGCGCPASVVARTRCGCTRMTRLSRRHS